MNKGIDCKIIEAKDGKTELEIEGQILMVPSKNLPSADGKFLKLFFFNVEGAIPDKDLAKLILEEILNGK